MERLLSEIQPEKIELRTVDSLQKIFMKKEPLCCAALHHITACRGEHVSFQLAYRYTEFYYSSQMRVQATKNPSVTIEAVTDADVSVRIRKVGHVPSAYPAYGEYDAGYLTTDPGLFPDVLEEFDGTFQLIPFYFRSLWIEVDVPQDARAGEYPIELIIKTLNGRNLRTVRVTLGIADVVLEEQELIHTEWFYSDCLADYYQIPVFSEDYWEITERFMRTAVNRGINMILTPLFTLPLDTLIGGERTTVQLVRVEKRGGEYRFDFGLFDRWIKMCIRCGFRYFEMGHLFSQWGAEYTPKIIADVEGETKQIFGWETKADSPEYREFLDQFLPRLTKKLKEAGIDARTYFHISDEPNEGNIDGYRAAREMVREYLASYPILDALSTLRFYKEGIVDYPVPTNEYIHEFLEAGVAHPWVYYCSGEYKDVSNRFFAMPSARLRIIGVQMYLYGVEGLLHWGYNYYNSQYSIRKLNPYIVTDADDAFPSGDSFLVYPGGGGRAEESLRLLVLEEGLNDYRILRMLEKRRGKEYVHKLAEDLAGMKITFRDYPQDSSFLLRLREAVVRQLEDGY